MSVLALFASLSVFSDGPLAWDYGRVESVLAREAGRPAVVLVLCRAWREPCHDLHAGLASATASASAPLRGVRTLWVDAGSAEGRRVKRRYRLWNVPTTLTLSPSGDVLGRFEGFVDWQTWVLDVEASLRGERSLAAAERASAAAPEDLVARARHASLSLAAGDPAALGILTELARREDAAGSLAARSAGGWLLDWQRDPEAAEKVLRSPVPPPPGAPISIGRVLWHGKALVALGRPQEALAVVDAALAASQGNGAERLLERVDFMASHAYPAADVMAAARAAVEASHEAYAHFVLAQALLATSDRAGAERALDEALRLSPGRALFLDFKAWLAETRRGKAAAFPFR